MNYENSRARAIKSIYFRARSNNHDASARVTLKNESYATISLDVEGEESMVAKVRDNLTEVFDGMRAWYAPVCRLDFYYVVGGAIALAYVILQGMSGGETTRQPLAFFQAFWFTLVIVGFIAAMAVLVWLLNRLRARFFPLGSYAIGQGLDRYELDDKARWAVLVGFGVSVIASIVAALLLPTS
jgi:hypothetical protein